jgi:hypothetical protein
MPRDAGGSFEITEGTGPIRAMLSTGELLEVYKVDKTFRVATPETIDPARTNPNAPFVVSAVQDVGTSNRIVARVLLQGNEILNSFLADEEKKNAIRRQLHRCKELLVCCETVANRVDHRIEEIEQGLKQTGIPIRNGRVLNPLPQVENLEADCGTFLLEANRAIRVISGLPSLFMSLERADKNFDHLHERLSKAIGNDQDLTKFVATTAPVICRLADMRNYFEHPAERRTVVKNIHVLPNGALSSPIWFLSGESPMPIGKDMLALVYFLVRVSEEMLIHLVLYCGRERFAFHVQATPDEQMDPNFPVKYKVLMFFKPSKAASPDHV